MCANIETSKFSKKCHLSKLGQKLNGNGGMGFAIWPYFFVIMNNKIEKIKIAIFWKHFEKFLNIFGIFLKIFKIIFENVLKYSWKIFQNFLKTF